MALPDKQLNVLLNNSLIFFYVKKAGAKLRPFLNTNSEFQFYINLSTKFGAAFPTIVHCMVACHLEIKGCPGAILSKAQT